MGVKCSKCGHLQSWHHANEIQELWDGTKFLRTCYGIGCTCGNDYGNVPKPRKIKKKKHWTLRLIKRQKIKAEIIHKRQSKKFHRKYTKLKNKLKIPKCKWG